MSHFPATRFLDRSTPPHIVTLVLLAGVSAMNMSIFLPSLPRMTEELGTEYSIMQLSVSLYLACTAVLQILIGPISDRFGRRPVVLGALTVFVLATIGCYFATTIEAFLTFRMIQATVAVAMVLSRAIVRDMVPQNEAASMIGYVTMGMSLVPMFAPAIGGVLDEAFGWRSTFLFLIVFGIGLTALCWFDQGETNTSSGMSFRAQAKEYPELFRSRRFWGYSFSAAFSSGAFFAFLGGAPYVATQVYGLPPTMTGFLFGMPAIGYFIGNFVSGQFSVRYGVNRMIIVGSTILITGLTLSLILTYAGFGSAWVFFGFCTFVGLGNGMVLPNATAGLLSVRPRLAGTASGIGSAIMIGGGAAMAALAGIALEAGEGSQPLQWLMWISAAFSVAAIFYVLRCERDAVPA
ncbi:multidrug effflux MFS transporter [Litoreibacter roseus]|uniref:Bcr/CflA family efflux transporter n=1 Tax=Litoreibacter roseus TaxID=2601869 RepID=A0A6N6JK61_9RHOB|nr:multidrug effflux MFS transporter [Litoreibacter roseus]GFE65678.1 Bcr/CflA family drug resistance efflux transporter [Litoreibacter roseus]